MKSRCHVARRNSPSVTAWSPTSRSALDVAYAQNPYPLRCGFCKHEGRCNLRCADDVRAVIEEETTGNVAAFIAEPIQGVGGFIEAPPGYFERVKEILDERGVLLIADEVQTGFGRTGSHFWGIEAFDVEPDLVVMAKGIGNGLAIGGVRCGHGDRPDPLTLGALHVLLRAAPSLGRPGSDDQATEIVRAADRPIAIEIEFQPQFRPDPADGTGDRPLAHVEPIETLRRTP